jgi:hypothetical protein
MYLVHFATVTVAQNALIPSMSSAFVLGFTSLQIYSFSSCHRFSIGLKSGDSGEVSTNLYSPNPGNQLHNAMYAWDHCPA